MMYNNNNEKEFDPDARVEKKMVETIITTTETGFAVSLKNNHGGCETIAFRFESVDMVDYDDHFDNNGIELTVLFKNGRDIRFRSFSGIAPEDLKKIWETLVDNM